MVEATLSRLQALLNTNEITDRVDEFDPLPDGGKPTESESKREPGQVTGSTSTISVNGYKFHYVEKGEGDPVIFVHGSLLDYRTWEHQLDPFAEEFHVIAYSRRYHYPNAVPTDSVPEYSYALHTTDLIEIIESLDIAPVTLVGQSYGADTSLSAAMQRPDLVDKLVLAEPALVPLIVSDPENPLHLLRLLIKDFSTGWSLLRFFVRARKAENALEEDGFEEGVRRFIMAVLGDGVYEERPQEIRERYVANAPAAKAQASGPAFPDFSAADVARVEIPTLILRGEHSLTFFRTTSKKLDDILPESERRVISRATHKMYFDNPEEFNQICKTFIRR